jgi:gamma-glutamylcyclotransferase (GGCT)/AIG2-like uncharacterized protein YtfP
MRAAAGGRVEQTHRDRFQEDEHAVAEKLAPGLGPGMVPPQIKSEDMLFRSMLQERRMPLYFAYGSNMDRSAMAERCPASTPLEPARLARHRLVITAGGYASVLRDARRTVWGLLWNMALSDMPALDRYEDVAGGLYVKLSQPVIAGSGVRRALIYVARNRAFGQPQPGYIETVVAAARDAGLPDDYLREIAALAPQAGSRAPPAPARPVRPLWPSPLARDAAPRSRQEEE